MKLGKLGFMVMMITTSLLAGTYNVDKSHSNVGFKVKHMMISNVRGEFNEFHGSFDYDEKTRTLRGLSGTVKVASIDTENEKRDKHLKSEDFFYADKHPLMKMELLKVQNDTAFVKLTIRGVSKDIKMELETSGIVIKDPWGNMRTGLSLSGKINRKDFGLNWNKFLETGGLMVGDTVKISIELEGILAK